MLTTLLVFLIVAGWIIWADESIKAGVFCGLFAGAASVILLMLVGIPFIEERDPAYKVPLQNLADGHNDASGDFFLGSGTIRSTPKYVWYEKTGANTYEQFSADANYSRIHYLPADKQPYVVKHEFYDERGFFNMFYYHINESGGAIREPEYDFYVPKGSITRNYKLDAQ